MKLVKYSVKRQRDRDRDKRDRERPDRSSRQEKQTGSGQTLHSHFLYISFKHGIPTQHVNAKKHVCYSQPRIFLQNVITQPQDCLVRTRHFVSSSLVERSCLPEVKHGLFKEKDAFCAHGSVRLWLSVGKKQYRHLQPRVINLRARGGNR